MELGILGNTYSDDVSPLLSIFASIVRWNFGGKILWCLTFRAVGETCSCTLIGSVHTLRSVPVCNK